MGKIAQCRDFEHAEMVPNVSVHVHCVKVALLLELPVTGTAYFE